MCDFFFYTFIASRLAKRARFTSLKGLVEAFDPYGLEKIVQMTNMAFDEK